MQICKLTDPPFDNKNYTVETFVSEIDTKGNSIPPTVFVSFNGEEPIEVETYL